MPMGNIKSNSVLEAHRSVIVPGLCWEERGELSLLYFSLWHVKKIISYDK